MIMIGRLPSGADKQLAACLPSRYLRKAKIGKQKFLPFFKKLHCRQTALYVGTRAKLPLETFGLHLIPDYLKLWAGYTG